jgi:tRNA(Leu) C34 or U34 (ribose-2'-O)-methylase TrmL
MHDSAAAGAITSAPAAVNLRLEFLLYGLQSPINIGMILRVAETYRFRVSIYDRYGVLENAEKFHTVKDFSCGAVDRQGFRLIRDDALLGKMLEGRRLLATAIECSTAALPDHRFQNGDLFALGNENDGLPDELIGRAETVLHIPMPAIFTPKPASRHPIDPARTTPVARDGQPNLNVAISAGIICYSAYLDWLARAGDSSPHVQN